MAPPLLDYTMEGSWFMREKGAKPADCFYVHPTTVLGLCSANVAPKLGAKVLKDGMSGDPDLLENHCSAFAACNLWVPMYAQAGMLAQISKNMDTATPQYEERFLKPYLRAYADVRRAFEAFLEQRPDRMRPFIVAGHSQGSILLTKVLKECIDGKDGARCFVAAYLAGGYVPLDLFGDGVAGLHNCTGPEDVGCVISYDTRLARIFVPESLQELGCGRGVWPHHYYYLLHSKYCERPQGRDDTSKARLQINPMTWTTADGVGEHGEYLGAKVHGSDKPQLPPGGGAAFGATVTVTSKAVLVEDPRSWYSRARIPPAKAGNLHPIDVQFWYFNIKANVQQRISAWVKKHLRSVMHRGRVSSEG